MFNSPVLDLVILLSFTYFIASLVLSAVNEAVVGAFARKAHLRKEIENLFFSKEWLTYVRTYFIKSPHIEALVSKPGAYPSYIPAANFVQAILESVDKTQYTQGVIVSLNDSTGKPILSDGILKVMQNIMTQVQALPNKMQEFEDRMEAFFNDAMDRAGGRYKKGVRKILLILGFLVAAILNIDTIQIINESLTDKKALASRVDKVIANLPRFNVNDSLTVIKDAKGKVIVTQRTKLDTSATVKPDSLKNINNLRIQLEEESGFHYGFATVHEVQKAWIGDRHAKTKSRFRIFFLKLIGIFITAFALQLGSNYWFDIMNKAVNIRAAGKKPDDDSK